MRKPIKLMNFLVKNQFAFNKSDQRSSYYKSPNFPYTIRISDHVGKACTMNLDKYINIIPQENDNYVFFMGRNTKTLSYKELIKLLESLFCVYRFIPDHFRFASDLMKEREKAETLLQEEKQKHLEDLNKADITRKSDIHEIRLKMNDILLLIGQKLR